MKMKIKDLITKLRKGVRAGMAAVKESNSITDNRILRMISDFEMSEEKKLMEIGERYYRVDNDIKNRKITRKMSNGKIVEETYKANNKLAHAKYKNMVDEKISYLLSNPVTYKTDTEDKNDTYIKILKDVLGKHFQYQLSSIGYEASNKGIGWLHVYINSEGLLKMMVIPSEQCIPLWKDRTHTELDMMVRVYHTYTWEYDEKKKITNVEVWTENDVTYYRLDGGLLIADYEKNNDNGGPVSHYKSENGWCAWGKIPFIPFKNNRIELPDIAFVKSLLDGYDLGRSEAANYVQEVKNLIFILKGYGGTDIYEFMKQLNEDRVIPIDDVDDGDVDALTPQMDITALKEHYEQLKRDIAEDGQSIIKDLDKFGNSPSGVALKFMYAGLDLKCNLMETEFKFGFEMLLYFVDTYFEITGQGNFDNIEVEIVFNRNMTINEQEMITNCNNSKGTVSEETILSHHPYVNDVEEEKRRLESERAKNDPGWDEVVITKGDGDGEE